VDIGERIARVMRGRGISQTELAQKLGIAQTTVSAWNKKGKNPSVKRIPQIANALGVSVDYLLTGVATVEELNGFFGVLGSASAKDIERALGPSISDDLGLNDEPSDWVSEYKTLLEHFISAVSIIYIPPDKVQPFVAFAGDFVKAITDAYSAEAEYHKDIIKTKNELIKKTECMYRLSELRAKMLEGIVKYDENRIATLESELAEKSGRIAELERKG